jgi:hypothetical protein
VAAEERSDADFVPSAQRRLPAPFFFLFAEICFVGVIGTTKACAA